VLTPLQITPNDVKVLSNNHHLEITYLQHVMFLFDVFSKQTHLIFIIFSMSGQTSFVELITTY